LEVEEVHAGYGRGLILQRLSLHVDDGELVSVIGPSGAGKSTGLKVIVGLLRPQAGRLRLAGEALDGRPPDEILSRACLRAPGSDCRR
jgi:branched-chain amino acid transport system ATP-binding protein